MYGPLILVNSTLANSARIEGEVEKKKRETNREKEGTFCNIKYITPGCISFKSTHAHDRHSLLACILSQKVIL